MKSRQDGAPISLTLPINGLRPEDSEWRRLAEESLVPKHRLLPSAKSEFLLHPFAFGSSPVPVSRALWKGFLKFSFVLPDHAYPATAALFPAGESANRPPPQAQARRLNYWRSGGFIEQRARLRGRQGRVLAGRRPRSRGIEDEGDVGSGLDLVFLPAVNIDHEENQAGVAVGPGFQRARTQPAGEHGRRHAHADLFNDVTLSFLLIS